MPRESMAFVLFMGAGFGLLWGAISLVLWSFDERVLPLLIAPLWLTSEVGAHLSANPLVVGALISSTLGLVPALALLAFARMRGW